MKSTAKQGVWAMRVCLCFFTVLLVVDITLAADAVNDPVHAEQRSEVQISLEGKRLFFDVHQRASTKTLANKLEGAVVSNEPRPRVDSASEDGEAPGARIRQQHERAYIALRYDARIESENYFRIIINGTPCDRVGRLLALSESPGRYLACSQLNESDLQLLLLADGKRVQVIRNNELVGILAPGQAL